MLAADATVDVVGTGGTINAEARAQMLKSVQLRSQLRQQRIRERVEQASTAEAAYLNPNEQWESYLARCGKWSPTGRGRKPSPERLRLAHQTANRIFSEAAAEAEQAVVENFGASEAAAAVAANAGQGPPELRAPIVDSHGMWVGEKIEAALSGAAGASSAALWRKKEDQKLEMRRLDYLAKAEQRRLSGASGAAPSSADAALNEVIGDGVAGLSSKMLYKANRERSGVMDEAAARAPTAPAGRQGVEERLLGDFDAEGGRRPVAGMTSTELYHMQHVRSHARAEPKAPPRDVAGVTSANLAATTTEMKLEMEPRGDFQRPDQRINSEVKLALTDHPIDVSDTSASLEVVSNAPSWKFHGAAGMTSGEVRKARSDLGQKRHTNSLDEGGASAPPAPVSVADAAAAPLRPSPVPRLAIEPGIFSAGGSPVKAQVAPEPTMGFAGQRSNLIQRPTSAWEARHVWSEQRKSPRGGFGEYMSHQTAALAGSAGLSSGQIAGKTSELKFEARESSPKLRTGAAAVAAAAASGKGQVESAGLELFNGAAGLTSSKICELGPGAVNKYDAMSPAKVVAHAERKALNATQPFVGRVPGDPTGAAGLTSKQIASTVISEQTAEQKRLSMLAAHAAQRSTFEEGGRPRALSPSMYRVHPQLSATAAFSGAAGVTSDKVGEEIVKREFFETGSGKPVPMAKGQMSPSMRRSSYGNSSAGVAAAIFGGEAPEVAVPSRSSSPRPGREMGHGLSSEQVALNRLVSRQSHGAQGGKRSVSEPRRRPAAAGSEAGSLLYANPCAVGMDLDIGISSKLADAARLAVNQVAGRSSKDLALPREERRLSRQGNAADNLMGFGGLGGFMGGGVEAGAARRHSVGQADLVLKASAPFSPMRGASPRPTPQQHMLTIAKPASPARPMISGSENAAGRRSPALSSQWVTSSSAVGAGWGAHQGAAQAQARFSFTPASPGTRGLRA